MLVINKMVYDFYVSRKISKLGSYECKSPDNNIHKIINLNGNLKVCEIPLLFLKSAQVYKIGLENFLKAYYNQDENRFLPAGDCRRLLAGRLLRKLQRKRNWGK